MLLRVPIVLQSRYKRQEVAIAAHWCSCSTQVSMFQSRQMTLAKSSKKLRASSVLSEFGEGFFTGRGFRVEQWGRSWLYLLWRRKVLVETRLNPLAAMVTDRQE